MFYRTPDERMINKVVAVNEDVAKGYDLAVVANAGGGLGIVLREPPDRLADDLEISLDRLAKQAVISVVLERFAAYRIAYERGGVADILKYLG